MPIAQRIVQLCLFLVAGISLYGGMLQLIVGQPETTARLDNVHRFMAGIYFGIGVIGVWAALTVRTQGVLVYLLAFSVFMAAVGRLTSMSKVGLPEPSSYWLTVLSLELVIPVVIVAAQYTTRR
jgi:hypothetical protein